MFVPPKNETKKNKILEDAEHLLRIKTDLTDFKNKK